MPGQGQGHESKRVPPKTARSHASQQQLRRQKSKSSPSYPPSQADSGTGLSAIAVASGAQRTGKGRAYSAPLAPRRQSPVRGDDGDDQAGLEVADDAIVEDPFFLRYSSPKPTSGREEARSAPSSEYSSDGERLVVPRSPRAVGSPLAASISPTDIDQKPTMPEINIAVLGAAHVGKSTFIQRAFDLQNRLPSRSGSRKMSIDGSIYVVWLHEIAFDDIELEDNGSISWPERLGDSNTSHIDGTLTLYDVTRQDTTAKLPYLLNAIHKAAIPSVLVSCKCDCLPAQRMIDPAAVEQKAKALVGNISAFQTAQNAPENYKRSLLAVLRAIAISRNEFKGVSARRRTNSSATRPFSKGSPVKQHARASSEFSGSILKAQFPYGQGETQSKPLTSPKSFAKRANPPPDESFLDIEESPGYESAESDKSTASAPPDDAVSEAPSNEKGYTFEQLVDRLLAQPMSKADNRFCVIFLALYRKFAAPSQLLGAIIRRFKALCDDQCAQIVQTIAQLRYLGIIEQWVGTYPGDFAHPRTRQRMSRFVQKLVGTRIFSVAAREIYSNLEVVALDDDTDWACCDKDRLAAADGSNSHEDSSSEDEFSRVINKSSLGTDSAKIVIRDSSSSSQSLGASTNSSSQTMLNAVENAQRQAILLTPALRIPCTKTQWHQLIDQPEEAIARELTRIDWIMFLSIRPRDLVRHVTLSADQRKKFRNLENVNRMISHFNHLAYWVANYVLLRDKPKHRAQMLEKFMKIARKLRELNNYNALGAILAGINGTAVHRLIATRELVPPPVAKDFMKLEILMGTQKSHFAYRLAWDNSSSERIPYLPLLRRDLVSAEEGNKTFMDEANHRINWRKFEVMGDVIIGMQNAQRTPYPAIAKNEEIKMLVLDGKIVKDDDELYERSILLEPTGGSAERRKFSWFQR